jgi:RNA polymerase sigma-70 factor (ECF subfamily)
MAKELDSALVAQARRGSAAALEALVRRYLRAAYAVALAILRNVADAEDVAQESLMGALQRLEQCREPDLFAQWLIQSVRNRAYNHLQQAKTRSAFRDGVIRNDVAAPPANGVIMREELLGALTRLSAVQREVVLLHDLEAWTHKEIATALEISEVMSRQHLFVARQELREHLSHSEQEPFHGKRSN